MLPASTEVLVVGAGPAGLTCAVTLALNGCKNITIVDAQDTSLNVSRAVVIHAQTIEELDSIGCVKPFTERGLHASYMSVYAQQTQLLRANFHSLAEQTKFPYALLISQAQTERILEKRLEELGVNIHRPYKLVGVTDLTEGIRATFESGESIDARYVVGADGARSMIRTVAGISFRDPSTNKDPFIEQVRPGENHREQNSRMGLSLVIADVHFSGAIPSRISPSDLTVFLGPLGFLLLVPLPSDGNDSSGKPVYRISCPSEPEAKEVTKERLRDVLSAGTGLTPEQTPVVETILWSSRFRIRSAVADQMFKPFGGGCIALVGDAAHVHSPAGGQGMNLGIRDAIALGNVLHGIIENDKLQISTRDAKRAHAIAQLSAYSNQRREMAIRVIKMTKIMTWLTGLESPYARWLRDMFWWIVGKHNIVNNKFALRLSGLQLKPEL